MPFNVAHSELCPHCPFGVCIEDRRQNRVKGRATDFRIRQNVGLNCSFDSFVPGTDSDANPNRTFDEYLNQHERNLRGAGAQLFPDGFNVASAAVAKVMGDAFQTLDAAAIWNATAVWNQFMDSGVWGSRAFDQPEGSVAARAKKVAAVPLPRGYDATKLFKDDVRKELLAHERALAPMELGMSSPDIVGVRIPEPISEPYRIFMTPLPNLGDASLKLLEGAYERIEGTLEGTSFLFAIAAKRTIRSDRLYQPLYEANVLKYLVQEVLRGATFRFHVHVGSDEGADIDRRYRSPSLVSLLRGGGRALAVDALLVAAGPRVAAQSVLTDYPEFHQ